jgi:plastocyanin
MNAFIIVGAVLAVWAVLVALLGMRGFPKNRGGERIAIAITGVLFLGAVGAAVADQTKVGERRGPEIDKPGEGHEGAKPGAPTEGAEAGGGASQPPADEPADEPRDPAGAPAEGGTAALTLESDPTGQLKFDKNRLTAPAGTVTITMTNPSPVPHNVALRGNGVDEKGEVVQGDAKSTVQAKVQPGASYEFYCSVPGHEQGGMKGTLTVR